MTAENKKIARDLLLKYSLDTQEEDYYNLLTDYVDSLHVDLSEMKEYYVRDFEDTEDFHKVFEHADTNVAFFLEGAKAYRELLKSKMK